MCSDEQCKLLEIHTHSLCPESWVSFPCVCMRFHASAYICVYVCVRVWCISMCVFERERERERVFLFLPTLSLPCVCIVSRLLLPCALCGIACTMCCSIICVCESAPCVLCVGMWVCTCGCFVLFCACGSWSCSACLSPSVRSDLREREGERGRERERERVCVCESVWASEGVRVTESVYDRKCVFRCLVFFASVFACPHNNAVAALLCFVSLCTVDGVQKLITPPVRCDLFACLFPPLLLDALMCRWRILMMLSRMDSSQARSSSNSIFLFVLLLAETAHALRCGDHENERQIKDHHCVE
jgi:hypothetical protein